MTKNMLIKETTNKKKKPTIKYEFCQTNMNEMTL